MNTIETELARRTEAQLHWLLTNPRARREQTPRVMAGQEPELEVLLRHAAFGEPMEARAAAVDSRALRT